MSGSDAGEWSAATPSAWRGSPPSPCSPLLPWARSRRSASPWSSATRRTSTRRRSPIRRTTHATWRPCCAGSASTWSRRPISIARACSTRSACSRSGRGTPRCRSSSTPATGYRWMARTIWSRWMRGWSGSWTSGGGPSNWATSWTPWAAASTWCSWTLAATIRWRCRWPAPWGCRATPRRPGAWRRCAARWRPSSRTRRTQARWRRTGRGATRRLRRHCWSTWTRRGSASTTC